MDEPIGPSYLINPELTLSRKSGQKSQAGMGMFCFTGV
jgi:hypothetical protein